MADCGLRLTHRTEDLAWPGIQKKKKLLLSLPGVWLVDVGGDCWNQSMTDSALERVLVIDSVPEC